MTPTPRAAVLLGLCAVAALVVPPVIAVLAGVGLLGAFARDAWALRGQVRLTRAVPPVVARGVPVALTAHVASPAGTLTVRHPGSAELSVTAEGDGRSAVLTAHRRGRHELPAPAVRRDGPLGLAFRHTQAAGEPSTIYVYPDLRVARRLADRARRGGAAAAGLHRRGPLGLGTEFESVRDYLPDDDVRQINWPASTRVGRPMSNQYRVERERELMLLLDSGRLMLAPIGDRTRLDLALDAAAAVGLVADALGDRCGAVAFDSELQRSLRPRRDGGAGLVRSLFDLEPRGVDSDYELAFRTVGRAKRAWVLIFTDVLEEAAVRSLVRAMPTLARRHAVAVVSVEDPDLQAAVTQRPERAGDVYTAAVALEVLAARDRAIGELRRAGARVVQAPADALAAACVDAYLSVQSRAVP